MAPRLVTVVLLTAALTAACGNAGAPDPTGSTVASTWSIRSPSTTASPTPAPARGRPSFTSSVRLLDHRERRMMTGVSWRPGCPVALDDLRLVTLLRTTYSGSVSPGRLVVNRDVADDVVLAFRALYRARFPIRRMRLVDHYGGSDRRSIAANNTSAFNCRAVPGSGVWSQHAYGLAVDINPVQNPYSRPDGYVEPARGRRYLDRDRTHRGMIHEGDAVVRAFDRIGWGWGGRWSTLKDWQHFSVNGR